MNCLDKKRLDEEDILRHTLQQGNTQSCCNQILQEFYPQLN